MTKITREEGGRVKITIGDVAEALGVSKTTVSRAISGKGRIGEETRQRVIQYIREHDYKPNVIAKGLAQSKTYNIGWVVPGDYDLVDLPFFQRCLKGVIEMASSMDYDVVISMVTARDIAQLERLINNHKVDGIILSRTLENDLPAQYLKSCKVPFVAVGTSDDKEVIQVDNDHRSACRELTSILLLKGMRRIGLVGGNKAHVVTKKRFQGYADAHKELKLSVDSDIVYLDVETGLMAQRVVEELLAKNVECILCMDDSLCNHVLLELQKQRIAIPQDVKVASFYNSMLLANHDPAITSLQFNAKEVGMVACRVLLEYLDGKEVNQRTLLGYDVVLKESAK